MYFYQHKGNSPQSNFISQFLNGTNRRTYSSLFLAKMNGHLEVEKYLVVLFMKPMVEENHT